MVATSAGQNSGQAVPGDEHIVIKRLRARMKEGGYDALVALSPDNVTYTSGFLVPSHLSNRFRRTITVIAKNDVAVQIVGIVGCRQDRADRAGHEELVRARERLG